LPSVNRFGRLRFPPLFFLVNSETASRVFSHFPFPSHDERDGACKPSLFLFFSFLLEGDDRNQEEKPGSGVTPLSSPRIGDLSSPRSVAVISAFFPPFSPPFRCR